MSLLVQTLHSTLLLSTRLSSVVTSFIYRSKNKYYAGYCLSLAYSPFSSSPLASCRELSVNEHYERSSEFSFMNIERIKSVLSSMPHFKALSPDSFSSISIFRLSDTNTRSHLWQCCTRDIISATSEEKNLLKGSFRKLSLFNIFIEC